jgi:quercetin dioxygenase-like cupin family protein
MKALGLTYIFSNQHRILNMRKFLALALISVLIAACTGSQIASDSITPKPEAESTSQVVLMSEVEWGPLNPARGDNSPRAGKLWGDRTDSGASGFLVQFVDGFSSPPHIHNITYRGVAISGTVHNDDPNAEKMWLPKGSFWTQPAGGVHITAAEGSKNLAYIEIDSGPYLVLPPEKAFQSEDKPINVDASNIVWVDSEGMPASKNAAKVAFLWGSPQDGQMNGTLVKLPAGFTGNIRSNGSTFHAVVIQGQPQYQVSNETEVKTLVPGSYFGSKGKSVHQVSSNAKDESIIYVRTDGKFDIIQAQSKK